MKTQCYARYLGFQRWNKICSPSSRSLQSGIGDRCQNYPAIYDLAPKGGIIGQVEPEISLDKSTGISRYLRKRMGEAGWQSILTSSLPLTTTTSDCSQFLFLCCLLHSPLQNWSCLTSHIPLALFLFTAHTLPRQFNEFPPIYHLYADDHQYDFFHLRPEVSPNRHHQLSAPRYNMAEVKFIAKAVSSLLFSVITSLFTYSTYSERVQIIFLHSLSEINELNCSQNGHLIYVFQCILSRIPMLSKNNLGYADI